MRCTLNTHHIKYLIAVHGPGTKPGVDRSRERLGSRDGFDEEPGCPVDSGRIVLAGLFSYLILPGLIEDQLARRLQTAFGAPTKPLVSVSSTFPPAMHLGHIDQVRVTMDRASLQGAVLYNTKADLKGVDVSVPQLLQGDHTVKQRVAR